MPAQDGAGRPDVPTQVIYFDDGGERELLRMTGDGLPIPREDEMVSFPQLKPAVHGRVDRVEYRIEKDAVTAVVHVDRE
jgi:hypothetical protein